MKLVLDNWLGGLSISDRMGKRNQYSLGRCADPGREIGVMQAGWTPAEKTKSTNSNEITNYINSFVVDAPNAKIYGIEKDDYIHTFNSDTGAWASRQQIANGTAPVGEDVKIYYIGTSKKLFYSYNYTGGANVGSFDLSSTWDDDYYTAVLSGAALTAGVPHKMIEFPGTAKLYIANGRYVAEIDGVNSTANSTAFALPEGWQIQDFVLVGSYLGILANFGVSTGRKMKGKMFIWDGFSSQFISEYPVDAEINAAINLGGQVIIFTNELYNRCSYRKFNGSGFSDPRKIRDGSDSTQRGVSKVNGFGSVTEREGRAIFTTIDGNVFSLGSDGSIYSIATLPASAGLAYGIIATTSGYILTSSQLSTTYYVHILSSGSHSNFLFRTMFYEFDEEIMIDRVILRFKTLASGANDSIAILSDYGNTTTTLGSIAYATLGGVTNKMFTCAVPCTTFQLSIDMDADATAGIKYTQIIIYYHTTANQRK